MSIDNRQIRIFISSTFRDMNEERDYLNNIIFPQIRQYCEQRFLHFIPIDLRWGITEEDSRNGLVLSTCMEEVDNSRPFFIGILGSRYGWQPSTNELGQLRGSVQKQRSWLEKKVKEGASITEMEIEYGVLRNMDIPYASFFIRGNDMVIPDDFREVVGSSAEHHLEQLKTRIRNQKKYPVTEYASIEQFGTVIKRQLIDMIEKEYPISQCDADDAILQKQEYILEKRSQVLCDMSIAWDGFQKWVNDASKKVIMINGQAGVGTSTMLAYCCAQVRKMYSCKILYFDLESVNGGEKPIDNFFHFLNLKENNIPHDKWSMIAIDNASTLRDEDANRILTWLQNLGENTYVAFALEQDSPLGISLLYSLGCPYITVTQYTPEQKRELISNYIQQFGKQLTESQIEPFLGLEKANITELMLLLRALVNFGSYEDLDNYISRIALNSFSQYLVWELQKDSKKTFAQINKILGDKYMVVLTAIAAAGTGISETDLMAALDLTTTEWSVIRPNVLQFCKGSGEGWKLSKDNWYPNVDFFDWENVSRHLIKWFTAHPETWHYAAPALRHLFFFIVVPPFSFEMSFGPVSADRPIVKDVLNEMFGFVMSPDMVKQLNDMEYSSLWTHSPLLTTCMSDTPKMVYGRTVQELPVKEAFEFYKRLMNTAISLSRNVDAAWCCKKISELHQLDNQPQSIIYDARTHLLVGECSRSVEILNQTGLIVKHKWSLFSRKIQAPILSNSQLFAMQQLLDSYCANGKWKDVNHLLRPIYNHIDACFTPRWNSSCKDEASFNITLEMIAKIAFAKSGYYPQIKDKQMAWKMLKILNNYTGHYAIGQQISFYRQMAALFLCYQSIDNPKLDESDKKYIYSTGWWAQISANVSYGYKSYQYARAHLLFTYIYYHLYHEYGSFARRLHDYVVRRNGRAIDHTDEYFYGSLDYGRSLESQYKKDIDWSHVDKDVQEQLLREYDFFWEIENKIQPEWYRPRLKEKRDAYLQRIHIELK